MILLGPLNIVIEVPRMLFCLMFMVSMVSSFKDAELAWREEREQRLKAEDGWLNLAGLFWLEEGTHRFGTDPDMEITLPPHSAVPFAGVITVKDGSVSYEMNRAQRATVDGETQNSGVLEAGEQATVLAYNHLRFHLIKRGERLAIRLRDLRSQAIEEFEGLKFFKPKKKYVVEATLERFDEPEVHFISTVVDTEIPMYSPGSLRFALNGRPFELTPFSVDGDPKKLFILFKDQTAETLTYPGGRYLYADIGEDDQVTLNFNRAYNPPCAVTPYATCPLPPAENWMKTMVEAGEKYDRKYH